jgi:hypothetical protein
MPASPALTASVLAGAHELLREHARALPQRDDFCGAFCGALALAAAGVDVAPAGVEAAPAGALDQDAVAVAAGTTVSAVPHTSSLPAGEAGRRDYRLAPPFIDDGDASGTTAGGLVRAIEELSRGRLVALPLAGPWNTDSLARVFDALLALERPATLVANVATRQLWGARASVVEMLDYLAHGVLDGPAPDWDVGHFTCVFARIDGPAGALYAIADTYPSLGARGLHLQPQENLALALERPGMAPGGLIAVIDARDAARVRERVREVGVRERAWDNGSVASGRRG